MSKLDKNGDHPWHPDCYQERTAAGLAAPRTCEGCALGPCKYGHSTALPDTSARYQRCNRWLADNGAAAIPTLCADCGAGPCQYYGAMASIPLNPCNIQSPPDNHPKVSVKLQLITPPPATMRWSMVMEYQNDEDSVQRVAFALGRFLAAVLPREQADEMLRQFKEQRTK